jgi:hypothetical protein
MSLLQLPLFSPSYFLVFPRISPLKFLYGKCKYQISAQVQFKTFPSFHGGVKMAQNKNEEENCRSQQDWNGTESSIF